MLNKPWLHSRFHQAAWWIYFGNLSVVEIIRVIAARKLDCFLNLGAYQVCDATLSLSIYSSLLLLMSQALVTRILVPGMSNFVNASVRRSLRRRVASVAAAACDTCFRFCAASARRGQAWMSRRTSCATVQSCLLLRMAPARGASCEAARRVGRLCALLRGLSVARAGAAGCAVSSGRAASGNAAKVEDGLVAGTRGLR